jgi:beta-glucosidase-like glycosyl hydrolase
MHALDSFGTRSELALAALRAGCDWLLACQSLDDGEAMIAAVSSASRHRSLERTFASSLRRITRLRKRLVALPEPAVDIEAALERAESTTLLNALAVGSQKISPTRSAAHARPA